jgi:glycosyltransferase involved in cell wall biosynthesis
MARRPRRLLSVAHSYCIALNRRLADEMARESGGEWEVTTVAPAYFHGELPTAHALDESCTLRVVPAYFTARTHIFLYGRALHDLMRQHWNVVHCWEEPYILAAGQIARWSDRATPFVFWTAQNIAKQYPWPFSAIERYCLERCSGWMACGHTIVETMLMRGYDQKPYRIMPLGVDLQQFSPDSGAGSEIRKRLGWTVKGPPIVGYLGRLVEEKGVRFLTRVLDRLSTPWRALFVGTGPLEDELRSWAHRHGDRVRIATGVWHHEVAAYLNAMDLLCAPSQTRRTWREQFGRMIIEGFGVGLPVVASDSGEIPHVVGDAGLIVSETDDALWVAALGDLLENPQRRRDLGERGIERAHSMYAWPIVAQNHLNFFRELIETHISRAH